MDIEMNTVTLNNGVEMPQTGYGVYQVSPAECERCVSDALSVGYRMIDTAQAYHNEEGVGNAVRKSGISRQEIFLVSKVWISNYGYEKAKTSIDESLRKLQTHYIDLMLLHQPFCDRYGAYRALEEAYKEGKLRAIGVSNFYPDHFIDIASNMEIVPAVNQVETHVFDQQTEPQKIMEEFGTRIMSWGPLAEGRNNFFTNPILAEIGTHRTDATEHRHIRLHALRRGYGGNRYPRHRQKPFLRPPRCRNDTHVHGMEVSDKKEFRKHTRSRSPARTDCSNLRRTR